MAEQKQRILVSACLLGMHCRYDGKGNQNETVCHLQERAELVPFCPEIYGGLATPRTPAERKDGKVVTKDGADVTVQYEKGAREALRLAQQLHCTAAVLKERSPSCGSRQIYDGTFTGMRIEGMGVCAELLAQHGIRVYSEETCENLL